MIDGNKKFIEIPAWSDLKAIIDDNSDFKYDHALKDDINELIVVVNQSRLINYYTRIKYSTADYTEYMTFYANKAERGEDSGILIDWEFEGLQLVQTEGTQPKLFMTDSGMEGLLLKILIELKKMNLQFELITDLNIKDYDLGGE
jgi:hypothetical protein